MSEAVTSTPRNAVIKVSTVVLLASSLSFISITQGQAATYPPSIQEPVAGEPIQAPVTPQVSGAKVLIPIAVSNVLPTLTKSPGTVSSVVKDPRTVQSNNVFDSKPVAPAKNVIVGGIPTSKKDDLPYVFVSAKSTQKTEIQVPQDVATSVFFTRLQPGAFAQINVIVNGKTVSLGTFRVAKDGSVEVPPLTLDKAGVSLQVQVKVGNTTRTVSVRSTK
jgi:hypothetical protein